MKPLTVSELTGKIKDLLEWNFNEVLVEGEISNLKISSAKHVYFNLVDEKSLIKAVIFKSSLSDRYRQLLCNGQKVVCLGRLSVYEPYGEYHIIVNYLQDIGDGLRYKKLEQDKKFLLENGYLENKKSLPDFPKRIIIITSPKGAAIRDILNILKRRTAGLEIFLYPVSVQGETSKKEILEALEFVNTYYVKFGLDVAILTRGGGSSDDLWIFNDLSLAIAFKKCKIPTISAIGHQIDQTLCDLVSDKVAETPSAAAEILIKAQSELIEKVNLLKKAIKSNCLRILHLKKAFYKNIWSGKFSRLVENLLDNLMLKIDNLVLSLEKNMKSTINLKKNGLNIVQSMISKNSPVAKLAVKKYENLRLQKLLMSTIKNALILKHHRLETLRQFLVALNPKAILKRGYSITFTTDNKVIKSINDCQAKDGIYTFVNDGVLYSIIHHLSKKNSSQS